MHYRGFRKSFSKIKIAKWSISVNEMPFMGKSGTTTFTYIIIGPEGYTVLLLKELSKSFVIYVRPLQEDIVPDINGPVNDKMTRTERLPMVLCTSCSKEIQLSVFENHRQQCALSQGLSKITRHFPVVSEKRSLFTSLQKTFPDKPLENLKKVATKTLDIQQAVEEVLAREKDYDGVHVQTSPVRNREVITSHINYQSKPKTNFKKIKMENLNDVLKEYRSQCLGTDVLKLQIGREER